MNLRQLEVFHAIMSTGSVTGAARKLNVTQPAVSTVLKHCEQQLQMRLFVRNGIAAGTHSRGPDALPRRRRNLRTRQGGRTSGTRPARRPTRYAIDRRLLPGSQWRNRPCGRNVHAGPSGYQDFPLCRRIANRRRQGRQSGGRSRDRVWSRHPSGGFDEHAIPLQHRMRSSAGAPAGPPGLDQGRRTPVTSESSPHLNQSPMRAFVDLAFSEANVSPVFAAQVSISPQE